MTHSATPLWALSLALTLMGCSRPSSSERGGRVKDNAPTAEAPTRTETSTALVPRTATLERVNELPRGPARGPLPADPHEAEAAASAAV